MIMGKKRIKKEYMGKILSNARLPKLVVANLEEDMYQFAEKMGFGFIFEDVAMATPKKIVKKKTSKSKKNSTSKSNDNTDDITENESDK